MALHHGAAGIKNVPAAPAAVEPDPTSASSNTVVDWIETKSQVVTVLPSKEVAYSSQEELFASVLYRANFALLCQICQTSNLHCHLSTSSKRDLGHVRDRMCLWGDALGDGRLEACLSPQDELHKSLISLLDRIGKTLITVMEQSISIREGKKAKWSLLKGLRGLLSEAASILSVDEPSSSICESDSDSASETDDDESQDSVVADIRSLQVYSKLLMDLCPTLEQAFYARQHGARENEPASGFKSFKVTQSALPWVGQVYEKFRTADNGLLERLGEANWQRFVRIRALISDSATAQESFEEPKTIFKPSTVHTFRDSALGASIPAQPEVAGSVAGSVASHTSFMSSVEGKGRNHLAVPRTPQQISRNEPFTCSFCGTLLKTLRNRIDWKMHIFSDLQAYICTFNDCHERLKTFSTRTLWSQHELEAHFSDKSFGCHDCHESSVAFADQESFLDHLSRVHGREALTHVHALSMTQAAAQSVPRSFTDQECPLCAQTDWKSQREYFTHVGKHLEQISLAALPQEEDESEDDSDQSDEKGPEISTSMQYSPQFQDSADFNADCSSLSILLVDDNAINRKIIATYVRKLPCRFTTASDGLEAVELYQKAYQEGTPFDVVLMDILMPVMDGFEATRTIRAFEGRTEIKTPARIIALTAMNSAKSHEEALASGVNLFLTKPVQLEKLKGVLGLT
ncbi:hypothetical protein GJ744_012427 [Endocarpon pusillum]|uniref:Response regulatory domain-containing protein n=1 Tax=Endocarpon pusillum TaxID=364733 RepID=A0A8H7ADR0_9EURO|nr:hypothetical protein GJ744_012427 [Endocarpon pusillum]